VWPADVRDAGSWVGKFPPCFHRVGDGADSVGILPLWRKNPDKQEIPGPVLDLCERWSSPIYLWIKTSETASSFAFSNDLLWLLSALAFAAENTLFVYCIDHWFTDVRGTKDSCTVP
jgi:hypothetical protein